MSVASTCAAPAPTPLVGGGHAPTAQPAVEQPPPTTPAPPVMGAGPQLAAALEQISVAIANLAHVLAAMAPVAGGGGVGGCGCAMAGAAAAAGGGGAYAGAAQPSSTPPEPIPMPAPAAAAVPAAPPPPPTALTPTDAQLAARIDSAVLAGTGLAGKGAVIVEAARRYRVPIDFALAVYQKEASFAKAGTKADRNNNPGNLRFADWQREHGGAPNDGFTKFPTMDDGIRASMALLARPMYADAVARRDWGAIISRYAPSFENDTAQYIRQMDQYTATFRDKLGVDEQWLHR
jgi:hypothetical protein